MINKLNLEIFINKFPLFIPSIKRLNEASIEWMIGGSGCLFLLGNQRIPDDVDIFLLDDQHDVADSLFSITSYVHNSPAGPVRNSNPDGDHSIQFTSHLEFIFDKHYLFSINDEIIKKKVSFEYMGNQISLLPAEDVLLIKGLLQRGPEEGKKDIEDIRNFMKVFSIDETYLNNRIKQLGAENRIGDIFLNK